MSQTAWPPPMGGPGDHASAGARPSAGYRSSWMRATGVTGLLAAAVASDVVGLGLDLEGLGLLGAAQAGTLAEADALAFDERYAAIGLVQSALFLASAVGVLAWLSRVVENIPPLTGYTPARGPRAAIGWWFVPFANYVMPYRIVADTVRRLDTGGGAWTERLLLPWWTLWIVANVVGSLLWRLPGDSLDDLRTNFTLAALSDAGYIAAGILLILIVRGVERQSAIRARIAFPGQSARPGWPQVAPVSAAVPAAPDSGLGIDAAFAGTTMTDTATSGGAAPGEHHGGRGS